MPEQGTDFLSRLFLGIRCKFKLLVFFIYSIDVIIRMSLFFVTGHILDDILTFAIQVMLRTCVLYCARYLDLCTNLAHLTINDYTILQLNGTYRQELVLYDFPLVALHALSIMSFCL